VDSVLLVPLRRERIVVESARNESIVKMSTFKRALFYSIECDGSGTSIYTQARVNPRI